MRVAILTPPPDQSGRADLEDTFIQADEIANCLDDLGHEYLPAIFGTDRDKTAATLKRLAPDIVFNLVEDVPEGPDKVHLAALLLDALKLRHTGASTAALEALGDKTRMKAVLREGGLAVPPDLADGGETTRFIVKSATEHASVGLSADNVVTGGDAARAVIGKRQVEFGGRWFAEAYVDGREFNLAILETADGPTVLPVAEVVFTNHTDGRPKIVGYEAKWEADSAAYAETPRVFPKPEPMFEELRELALSAWRLFALTGYARADFRVDAGGNPYILELNANPCLSADAGFCAAAAEMGLSQTDVIAAILKAAR